MFCFLLHCVRANGEKVTVRHFLVRLLRTNGVRIKKCRTKTWRTSEVLLYTVKRHDKNTFLITFELFCFQIFINMIFLNFLWKVCTSTFCRFCFGSNCQDKAFLSSYPLYFFLNLNLKNITGSLVLCLLIRKISSIVVCG